MKPKRRENLSSKQVGDERIIHDPETDTVHVLKRTASLIWDLIDGSRSFSEIEEKLIKHFSGEDPSKLKEMIRSTITDFSRKRLIEVHHPPLNPLPSREGNKKLSPLPHGERRRVRGNKKEELLEEIEKNPEDKENYNLLGIVYMAEGSLDNAIDSFKKALDIDPEFTYAMNNLGSVYFIKRDMAEAENAYNKVLSINPNHAEAMNNLGNVYSNTGREDEALGLYKKALEKKPEYPDALENLGNLYRRRGQNNEAIGCYKEALRIEPGHLPSLKSLTEIYLKGREFHKAGEAIENALKVYPKNIGLHDTLIGIYKTIGKHLEAVNLYRKAMAISKDINMEIYKNIGRIHQEIYR